MPPTLMVMPGAEQMQIAVNTDGVHVTCPTCGETTVIPFGVSTAAVMHEDDCAFLATMDRWRAEQARQVEQN